MGAIAATCLRAIGLAVHRAGCPDFEPTYSDGVHEKTMLWQGDAHGAIRLSVYFSNSLFDFWTGSLLAIGLAVHRAGCPDFEPTYSDGGSYM